MQLIFARFVRALSLQIFLTTSQSSNILGIYFLDDLYLVCENQSFYNTLSPVNRKIKLSQIKAVYSTRTQTARKGWVDLFFTWIYFGLFLGASQSSTIQFMESQKKGKVQAPHRKHTMYLWSWKVISLYFYSFYIIHRNKLNTLHVCIHVYTHV